MNVSGSSNNFDWVVPQTSQVHREAQVINIYQWMIGSFHELFEKLSNANAPLEPTLTELQNVLSGGGN